MRDLTGPEMGPEPRPQNGSQTGFLRTTLVRAVGIWPGLLLSLTIALGAGLVAEDMGGPHLLYALVLGIALGQLADGSGIRPGIEFTARSVLRFGVALLGARVTTGQIAELGLGTVLLVVVAVGATILFGRALARPLGLDRDLGMLSGGATAICGVSAAMALSAVMPRSERHETNLILTVVGVTGLSTLAMVIYPVIAQAINLDTSQAGVFLGGSIHDVAQVVGAGYIISSDTGEAATVVKLMRVALLVPAVLVFGMVYRVSQVREDAVRPPLLPGFLVGFVVLVLMNSAGVIPVDVTAALTEGSRWCLVISIAALGLKTSLGKLTTVGWRPLLLMVAEAGFIAALVLGAVVTGAAG